MDKRDFYTGQILARCNSNILQMKHHANRCNLFQTQILYAKTEALIEILEKIFNYKNTEEMRDKMILHLNTAKENDYLSSKGFI